MDHTEHIAGRYTLGELLREGRHGQVYRATDAAGGPVSLKLFIMGATADPDASARFDREAKVMASLNHPGIPRVLDHGHTDDGRAYLVTEWVIARSLAEVAAVGPVDASRVQAIGVQVALVLAAAHAQGIVHRDLCADNIYLAQEPGQEDVVKVLDFGLAHVDLGDDADLITATGMHLGSTLTMAPEYILDTQALDHRVDLYALGVVLYHLLCGAPPFVGEPFDVLRQHTTIEPIPPARRNPAVPGWLDRLIVKLLEKRPGDRPQDAHTVAHALLVGG